MLSAVDLLKKSNSPLIIVGKGAAYSRAEHQVVKLMIMFMNMIKQVESVEDLGGEDRAQVRSLTKALGIPVLATPMGKGRFLYNHGGFDDHAPPYDQDCYQTLLIIKIVDFHDPPP